MQDHANQVFIALWGLHSRFLVLLVATVAHMLFQVTLLAPKVSSAECKPL